MSQSFQSSPADSVRNVFDLMVEHAVHGIQLQLQALDSLGVCEVVDWQFALCTHCTCC